MISLRSIQKADITIFEEWLQDKETRSRMGGMLPLEKYLPWAIQQENVIDQLASKANEPIGNITFEIYPDNTASISLIVNPKCRGKGYSLEILNLAMEQPKIKSLREIHSYIEPDNLAAISCFTKAGYQKNSEQPDSEGYLNYVYKS